MIFKISRLLIDPKLTRALCSWKPNRHNWLLKPHHYSWLLKPHHHSWFLKPGLFWREVRLDISAEHNWREIWNLVIITPWSFLWQRSWAKVIVVVDLSVNMASWMFCNFPLVPLLLLRFAPLPFVKAAYRLVRPFAEISEIRRKDMTRLSKQCKFLIYCSI